MNVLEHHIVEIYSEKEIKETGKVEVHFKIDCWGSKEVKKMTIYKSTWDMWKQQGYYLG